MLPTTHLSAGTAKARFFCNALALSTDETTMIGDTMETDILGGVQLGLHTVLVLTGGTKRADLGRYAYSPELVVDSIADLHEILVQKRWEPWWSLRSPVGRRREVAA